MVALVRCGRQIRTDEDTIAQRLIDAAVALTLIVAGCSLAVAVGGGLVDRKRPFTLLRVSGVPVSVRTGRRPLRMTRSWMTS